MRVAMVSREFPPTLQSSGIATYTHKTARALSGAGHEVHVFAEAHCGAPLDESIQGVFVHRLPNPGVRPRELRYIRRSLDVARALRAHGPFDIVQACEWEGEAAVWSQSPQAPLVTRLATPRYLVESLNQTRGWERRRSLVTRGLERFQTRHSSMVICPSLSLANVVARDWRIKRSRIKIVPTGIELPLPGADGPLPHGVGAEPYILYFGRLELRKGVKTWLDALPAVLSTYPEMRAVFAGEDLLIGGELFSEYGRRRAGRLASRLEFLPRLPQSSLFPLIASACLVVLPSRWESIANACLEAMALGRAVVATAGSGFAELIDDGVSGWLVPPDDPAALADVVNHALSDPVALLAAGDAARKRAHDFSIDRMAGRLIEAYSEVVGREDSRTHVEVAT